MAHGDAREGKWRGNWRMEWVASFTLPRSMVYPALLPLIRTTPLPVIDWTDAPADLNGFVRFAEGRNLVSARVPSHFKRSLASIVSGISNKIYVFCRMSANSLGHTILTVMDASRYLNSVTLLHQRTTPKTCQNLLFGAYWDEQTLIGMDIWIIGSSNRW